MIEEGTILHHCVKTYVDRVRKGDTVVLFIRRSEEPNTPYFTMEVHDGRVYQIRGNCNAALNDSETKEFLRKWAGCKNVIYSK